MKLILAMLQFLLSKTAKSAANLRREISKVAPKRKRKLSGHMAKTSKNDDAAYAINTSLRNGAK